MTMYLLRIRVPHVIAIFAALLVISQCAVAAPQPIRVTETDAAISIDTDALSATIAKKGYVSGIKGGSFLERFLYQRPDDAIPQRMIRAYQVKLQDKPGPWLAGMTLDPAEVCEAWCHQRGYVCMIQEMHRRHVNAGEAFGAAYIVGWFDGIPQMQRTYDQFKGARGIEVNDGRFQLIRK